jgi:hypothetical protein
MFEGYIWSLKPSFSFLPLLPEVSFFVHYMEPTMMFTVATGQLINWAIEPADHELKHLTLWVKINLYSFKLFPLGICHREEQLTKEQADPLLWQLWTEYMEESNNYQ